MLRNMRQEMSKYIYYGAGEYAREHFEDFKREYEPLCFCDRAASEGGRLFGLPVLPPLAMFEQYPDAPIVLTLHPGVSKHGAQTYLLDELGVPAERIVNYISYEKALSCWFLDNFVRLHNDHWSLCCSNWKGYPAPNVYFDKNDTPRQKVVKLLDLRNSIKKTLKDSEPCTCTGCPGLEQLWFPTKPLLELLLPVLSSVCNLRCVYCSQKGRLDSFEEFDAVHVSSLIEALRDEGLIHIGTSAGFSFGEITLHPRRKEMLSTVESLNTRIESNCVIYDDVLVQHLSIGKSVINCSIDAGTRETYAKIKGADFFERVCENLKRYSQLARIELKYIFIVGENDDDKDVEGFIRLASEIRPKIVILAKELFSMSSLSDQTINQMAKISLEMNKIGVKNRLANDSIRKEEKERFFNLINKVKR